jgi:hypothetical protein
MPDWLIVMLMPFGAVAALGLMALGSIDLRDRYRAMPAWGQWLAQAGIVGCVAGIVFLSAADDPEQRRLTQDALNRLLAQ